MKYRLKPSMVTRDVLRSAACTYFCWPFLAFLIIAFVFGQFAGVYAATHEVDNKDLSNLLLTYNALVLSFSLASITLVIALPSREFVIFLAKEREAKGAKISPLKNLILCFFQSAFAHYVSLTLVMPIFLFAPDKISVRMLISPEDWVALIFLIQA